MKPRLLIVDDEQAIRDMLKRHFCYLGYDIQTASDGQEAVEKLNETKIEVVISDIKMPRKDGIELLRYIRDNFPMVRTIMVTGYVNLENALSCMRLRAQTCIFKPLTEMKELEDEVKKAVEDLKHWQDKFKALQAMKV